MPRTTWRVEDIGGKGGYKLVVETGPDEGEEFIHSRYVWEGMVIIGAKGRIHLQQMHRREPGAGEAPQLMTIVRVDMTDGKSDQEGFEDIARSCQGVAERHEEEQRRKAENRRNTLQNLGAMAEGGARELD